jgi:nitrite reductase/ring-hydroxylating ferredoxin subunit
VKSRYGWKVPSEDVSLTHVEAGSPMGELMRRYWQPVALSEELTELPKRIRILCEDLVVFRTKNGKVGCLELHCSHRGTSLEWGRVEADGIRCCYHGWLYDTEGRVRNMACESAEFCNKMAIEHPAYPVHEFGGLVFIYMGPPEKKPLFPMYDIYDTRYRKDVVLKGMRIWGGWGIGYVNEVNWLQHYENFMDPWHLLILHQMISGDHMSSATTQSNKAKISWVNTPLGTARRYHMDLPNGNRLMRHAECVLPNIFLLPNIHDKGTAPKREDRATECTWVVPIDNGDFYSMSIVAWPLENGEPKRDWKPGTDTAVPSRPGTVATSQPGGAVRPYEERQRKPDDQEAQQGQRRIAVHALENLAHSDLGIVMLRRALREQLKRIERGEDPINVLRDESRNHRITTSGMNSILTREEANAADATIA